MPNRIIRESCRTSPTLAQLSGDGERLFWRLTTVADDFGRFEADPRILKSECFPLNVDTFKTAQVARWFGELVGCGLVTTYVVNGRTLGFFNTWDTYQRKRAATSKYPPPPDGGHPLSSDNIGGHMLADSPEKREARSEKRDTEDAAEPRVPPSASAEDFVAAYNRACTNLPRCVALTQTRRAKIRVRLEEHPLAWWCQVFTRANVSSFLRGADGGWHADFTWFIANGENALKVLEGKYDRGTRVTPVQPPLLSLAEEETHRVQRAAREECLAKQSPRALVSA